MKVCLYRDETIALRLDEIIGNLNRFAPSLNFHKGITGFSLPGRAVFSGSYAQMDKAIDTETSDDDNVLLFTEKAYDNNYFWDSPEKKIIVSLSGWDHLTNLSRNNGAVYFACAILVRDLRIGSSHKQNTGCINDFWWDKTGIDVGMRSAFVCPACLEKFRKDATHQRERMLHEIQAILNEVSAASRANMDICDFWGLRKENEVFDVFLCHNSQDKQVIRGMNARLKGSGIRTWFDEEQLRPGWSWRDGIEDQIAHIRTAAVFVENSGIGPWQDIEISGFLREFVRRRCPVIPVILPNCAEVPELPLFLRQLTWVDFRRDTPDPYNQLLWGIRGTRP